MATTWSITECQRYRVCPAGKGIDGADTYEGQAGVVYNVFWSCQDQKPVDGVLYTARKRDNTLIEPFVGGDFVAYDAVTEAQIIDWVHVTLGAEGVTEVEAFVNEALDAKGPPKTETGVPWK